MIFTIDVRDTDLVIEWLTNNVGPIVKDGVRGTYYVDVIGEGWSMTATWVEDQYAQLSMGLVQEVNVIEEKSATQFALRWT